MSHVSIIGSADTLKRAQKSITFDGSAGNGAIGSVSLFTVTGLVIVRYTIVKCTADLTEDAINATVAYGITNSTGCFNQAHDIDDLTNGVFFGGGDLTPAAGCVALNIATSSGQINNTLMDYIIEDDIIFTVATANVDGGTLTAYVVWEPLSNDGDLVVA